MSWGSWPAKRKLSVPLKVSGLAATAGGAVLFRFAFIAAPYARSRRRTFAIAFARVGSKPASFPSKTSRSVQMNGFHSEVARVQLGSWLAKRKLSVPLTVSGDNVDLRILRLSIC